MPSTEDAERIAKTESLFREVNERIADSAERFDAKDAGPSSGSGIRSSSRSCARSTPAPADRFSRPGD